HGDAFEVGLPAELGQPAADGLERVAHLAPASQIELDPAHVALVRYGPGVQLDRDRVAERLRLADGLFGGCCGARLHGGDAVRREDALRLQLGEKGPAVGAGRAQDLRRLVVPEGGFLGERRSLVEAAEIVCVLPHVAEHSRRGIGIVEGGNVRVGENAPSGPPLSSALAYVSASALPSRSTGLPGAGSPPAATSASVARTAGPPALVRMLSPRPFGRGRLGRLSG